MIDVHKASDKKPTRLFRTIGPGKVQRPGTLSPDPWHFALWASSTILRQGDAAALTASPVPLDCRGARGACQQSPILRSSSYRLPKIPGDGKGYVGYETWDMGHASYYRAIGPKRKMPGVWGQSPQGSASVRR